MDGPPASLHLVTSFYSKNTSFDQLATIQGRLKLRLPVSCHELTFNATDRPKDQSYGGLAVSWGGYRAGVVSLKFQGAVEKYVATLEYDGAGKPLRRLSACGPQPAALCSFPVSPSKVVVIVADDILERTYPFRLTRLNDSNNK
jgi:hypothetical protein